MSTPDDAPYKLKQGELRARLAPRVLVTSAVISAEGLQLRRTPKGTQLFQTREPRQRKRA